MPAFCSSCSRSSSVLQLQSYKALASGSLSEERSGLQSSLVAGWGMIAVRNERGEEGSRGLAGNREGGRRRGGRFEEERGKGFFQGL